MLKPKGEVGRFAGRSFHWRLQHGDGPTVVLMAGCGLAMEFWKPVVSLLGGRRVLAYDRPGMGGTRWPGRIPTLAEEVASLAEMLATLADGPAVLVAHSMAAFHAEALTRVRPDLVRGVVLVDPSVEWQVRRPEGWGIGWPKAVRRAVQHFGLGRPAGALFRFGAYLQSNWDFERLGNGRMASNYRDHDALAMATAESLSYERQAWDLLGVRARHAWPRVRCIVLHAADSDGGRELATQRRLAELLGAGFTAVETSRHLMMLDRPDAVVEAVRTFD